MEKAQTLTCLFCGSNNIGSAPYENAVFKSKIFEFRKCRNCKLEFLDPMPSIEDLSAVYSTEYIGDIFLTPNGSYNWLFDKIKTKSNLNYVLDFGCGGGRFITEAKAKGYKVKGVEFTNNVVENLKNSIQGVEFQTVDELWGQMEGDFYDIIFLGNVLEHLPNPTEIISKLKDKIKKGGLLILEGPIESNISLATSVRKFFFGLRKKMGKVAYYLPKHLFYSNAKNQLEFFEKFNFETLYYDVQESSWPFPVYLKDCKSPQSFILYFIAKLSIWISGFNKYWGNNFVYIGLKK